MALHHLACSASNSKSQCSTMAARASCWYHSAFELTVLLKTVPQLLSCTFVFSQELSQGLAALETFSKSSVVPSWNSDKTENHTAFYHDIVDHYKHPAHDS